MSTITAEQELAGAIAERKRLGLDRYDEVWEGTYVMTPLPNDEHAGLASDLCAIFKYAIQWSGMGLCREGVNISDRRRGWTKNFRAPDVCVMLKGGRAVNYNSFWHGGPDFVVEIASPDEDPHKKIEFYESVGVRELLVIDREPWKIELFRLANAKLKLVGVLTSTRSKEIVSQVIPFGFKFVKGDRRPGIAVRNTNAGETRTI